jgi:DNA-binding response OmpR family regulator
MTTGANVRHRLAGLTLGAEEFLSKPIDMRELILRIRVRLGG